MKIEAQETQRVLATHKVGRVLAVGLAVALLALEHHLVARVVPALHHEVLHGLGLLFGRERRARLDLADLRLQRRLLVLVVVDRRRQRGRWRAWVAVRVLVVSVMAVMVVTVAMSVRMVAVVKLVRLANVVVVAVLRSVE